MSAFGRKQPFGCWQISFGVLIIARGIKWSLHRSMHLCRLPACGHARAPSPHGNPGPRLDLRCDVATPLLARAFVLRPLQNGFSRVFGDEELEGTSLFPSAGDGSKASATYGSMAYGNSEPSIRGFHNPLLIEIFESTYGVKFPQLVEKHAHSTPTPQRVLSIQPRPSRWQQPTQDRRASPWK